MEKLINNISEELKKLDINFDKISFLAGDASNRKYFKIFTHDSLKVLMLDNSSKNSIENFLKKTAVFRKLGIKVPEIYECFSNKGILIMENFGDNKFSNILTNKNEEYLYKIAIDSLIYLHTKKTDNTFEVYNKSYFLEEMFLFFDWYLPLFKKKVTTNEKDLFFNYFDKYLDDVLKLPIVNIHRDFHVDNLFYIGNEVREKKCGWIDYQDALIGNSVYDLMSLLEDARRDIDENLKNILIDYYFNSTSYKEKELFMYSFGIIAIQRHMKVLGIFSRLHTRDKKSNYLIHLPRVKRMLKKNLLKNNFRILTELILPLID